jgi:general secretion pathway protein D
MACRIAFAVAISALVAAIGGQPHRAAAAGPVLESVQTQVLPNQHIRVLLQFNAPVALHPQSTGISSSYLIQVPGATPAQSVQNVMPVNLGSVETITVSPYQSGINITLTFTAPLRPTFGQNGTGIYVIDVPPAAGVTQNADTGFAQAQQTPAPAQNGNQITKIVRLSYADVSEVVGILTSNGAIAPTSVFNPQPSEFGSQQSAGFGTTGGFQGPLQGGVTNGGFQTGFGQSYGGQYGGSDQNSVGQRVTDNIAVDRRLNAVILTGTPEQVAQAEQIIKMLDVPVQSVLLDTEVLEVTATGAKALGLNYNQSTTSPLAHIYNAQAAALAAVPSNVAAGSLAIQSDIFLLVNSGQARVLASPKILTEDGVPASILSGDSLPIRVTTPVGFNGATAVSSQVEYINVGVNLQILPHVTENGGVNADIYSVVSSVTGFSSSNDPQISTRQAQTRVNLLEGQTLVIGGLLQQQDIRNLQKIPILGDLPIIGALFRFYTQTRSDTNLIITITPHVVPPPSTAPPIVPAPHP